MQPASVSAQTHEGGLQGHQPRVDAVDRLADPQPQIGRDLVIAAAGRVQLAPHLAEPLDECPFDVHVNVFELDVELEAALLNFAADVAQGLLNSPAFVVGEQADVGQHLGMRDRGGDIVRIKAAIEAHTFSELLHAAVGRLLKNAAPSLFGHAMLPVKSALGASGKATCQLRQHIYCKQLRKRCQTSPSRPAARAFRAENAATSSVELGGT